MSKLDEFLKTTAPAQKGFEVEGLSLCCQVCNEQVDVARYYSAERILSWRCEEGHMSYMENFNL